MLHFFNRLIRWSFYLLIFLVPIIFTGNTSELFEFNKMWITYGLTLVIASSWISTMIIKRQVKIFTTPLDIPILLFLFSQVLATIFSIDPHTSLWGYYSRFNGGLYSLLSYALLYFAFVNTVGKKDVMKYVYTGIASAVFVALWGLPSHFGYDPTCFLFRGTFDVSCWTSAFQPKVRIFSTLGQPDWLAAYLVYMLPIAIALGLIFWKLKKKLFALCSLLFAALFYADLLFTGSRSGFLAGIACVALFLIVYIAWQWRSFARHPLLKAFKHHTFFLVTLAALVVLTFLISAPVSPLDKFSLTGIQTILNQEKTVQKALTSPQPVTPPSSSGIPVEELGGTDSGKIRLFVWQGALQIFLHHPILGTGVETFGYAYYQFRPAGHNLTSEWDYLYNKAHNEFLNYLATTGIVGFGTYLVMLGYSLWVMIYGLTIENRKLKMGLENGKSKMEIKSNYPQPSTFKNLSSIFDHPSSKMLLLLALLAGYIGILITNFFGFSVVIMNVYLFLTPAFALLLSDQLNINKTYTLGQKNESERVNEVGWVGIGIVWIVAFYFLVVLLRFWLADVSFAMGQNLDNANAYQAAYPYLHDAVATRPSEPTFQNELSINDAVLSTALFQQKDTINGTKLRDEAIAVSDKIVAEHPNIVTFWKSRVRIFYTLAQVDPHYLSFALAAIQKAATLAPTDAKVWYNLGLLYDQTGDVQNAIATMKQTIVLKADYRDAYYALALFYRQEAVGGDMSGKTVTNQSAQTLAVSEMHFILANFGPDKQITDTLTAWGEK